MALNLKAPMPPKPAPEEPKVEKKPVPKVVGTSMAEVLKAIRKDKGDMVVVPASQIPPVKRLPTGNFEFDFYTGGGFPRGRITIVYGPEASWKTGNALQAIASAQKNDPPECNKAVLVNIEQTHDSVWAAKLGVDINALHIANPGYGEEAVDLIDALVRADDLSVLVVDSVAALIASKEIAQSVEKYDIGTSALLIKRLVNKLMVAFCEEARKGHFPTVILINQTRFKPGVMFGDPETMPGGEAQKFLSSLRIRNYGKKIVDKATNTVQFLDIHSVIKKAKVPVRAADFDYKVCVQPDHEYLKIGDTDSFNTVKSHLQALGLLEKVPKGYTVQSIVEGCSICSKLPKIDSKCPLCHGTNMVARVFSSIAALQDEYYKVFSFKIQMQKLVIDAYGEKDMILVEAQDDYSPKDVPSGKTLLVQDDKGKTIAVMNTDACNQLQEEES